MLVVLACLTNWWIERDREGKKRGQTIGQVTQETRAMAETSEMNDCSHAQAHTILLSPQHLIQNYLRWHFEWAQSPHSQPLVVSPEIIKASLVRLFENREESISYQWPMEHLTVQFHNHCHESIAQEWFRFLSIGQQLISAGCYCMLVKVITCNTWSYINFRVSVM